MSIRSWELAILLTVLTIALPVTAAAQVPDNATCKPNGMDYPIVDMHTHVFNFRYLPLKGILYRFHVPYSLANSLADALILATAATDTAPVDRARALDTRNLIESDPKAAIEQRLREAGQLERLQRHRKDMLDYVIDGIEAEQGVHSRDALNRAAELEGQGAEKPTILTDYFLKEVGVNAAQTLEQRSADAAAPSLEQQLAGVEYLDLLLGILKKAFDIRDTRDSFEGRSPVDPVTGFIRMIRILMMSEREILDYLAAEYCEVDVFVHHMMDMEKVYNNKPTYLFNSQIDKVFDTIGRRGRSDFVTFTAHDPFRLDPDYTLLAQALARGAKGIKYYPPSGYSPSHMAIPDKPDFWFYISQWKVRKQWKSRYGHLRSRKTLNAWEPVIPNIRDLNKGEIMDEMNKHFFRWAKAKDVPIFSHHTPSGFQAQGDYGEDFAKPCYWGEILMGKDNTSSEFRDLKLILGHTGGGEHWFSDADDPDWIGSFEQQAYNLCVLFENVYCDFGFHNEVLDTRLRDNFQTRLRRLAGEKLEKDPESVDGHPLNPAAEIDLCNYKKDAPPIYDIRKKIIYGSDWMMVSRLKDRDFISSFRTVFEGEHLENCDKRFFGGNALHLLGIVPDNTLASECAADVIKQ